MTLHLLEHKLDYIKIKISPYVQAEWQLAFKAAFSRLTKLHEVPRVIERQLCLDLCYIIVRHHPWLGNRLLQNALVTFLAEEYRLPRDASERLCAELFAKAREFIPAPPGNFFQTGERNFLLYIFVHALTAKNNECLIADLGLGTHLLQRLQEAAHYLHDYHKTTGKVYFQAGHDSTMIGIITELSEARARTPWIAQQYHLLFITADIAPPWGDWLINGGIKRLFDFFLHLGEVGSLPRAEALAWWEGEPPAGTATLPPGESITALWEALIHRRLIDSTACPIHSSPAARKSRRTLARRGSPKLGASNSSEEAFLQLCPLAWEITAEAFAERSGGQLNAATLNHLHPAWQAAFLSRLDSGSEEAKAQLEALLGQELRLHPEAMEAMARKMPCNSTGKKIFFDLVKITTSGVPSIRAAACRSLGQLATACSVGEILSEIAINDGSALVRETALLELGRAQPTGAFTLYRKVPLGTGKIA